MCDPFHHSCFGDREVGAIFVAQVGVQADKVDEGPLPCVLYILWVEVVSPYHRKNATKGVR